jgi:hypothetical protein
MGKNLLWLLGGALAEFVGSYVLIVWLGWAP